jgi:hypothetical protein
VIFEMRAQSCKQIRGHFHRRNGHGDSITQFSPRWPRDATSL